jgi:hypothetical protein
MAYESKIVIARLTRSPDSTGSKKTSGYVQWVTKVVRSIPIHVEAYSIQRYVIRGVWRYQRGCQNPLITLWNICVTNDHGYVPLVVNTSRSFLHSWLVTGFLPRLIRCVSLVVRGVWRYQRGCQNPLNWRTDNTMTKRRSTKGQTTIHKTYRYN